MGILLGNIGEANQKPWWWSMNHEIDRCAGVIGGFNYHVSTTHPPVRRLFGIYEG